MKNAAKYVLSFFNRNFSFFRGLLFLLHPIRWKGYVKKLVFESRVDLVWRII